MCRYGIYKMHVNQFFPNLTMCYEVKVLHGIINIIYYYILLHFYFIFYLYLYFIIFY